jgi:hypothetical protein
VSYNFSPVWSGGRGIITEVLDDGDYNVQSIEVPKDAQSLYPDGDHSEWSGEFLELVAEAEAEVRSVSSTGAEKGTKPERFDLLPSEALAVVARHYGVGAAKYSAHNWRKGYEWSKSYAALQRHANAFWAGEDIDEETGSPHMAGVAFHALTLITFMAEHPEMDDRFATVGAEESSNSS